MKAIIAVLLVTISISLLQGQSIQAIRPAYDLSFVGDKLPLPDGGVLIVWRSTLAGDADVYAQRFSSEGLPVWNVPVAVVCKAGTQYYKSMFISSEGNYLITWNDSPRVWGQLLNPQGQKLWPEDGILLHEQSLCWLAPNQAGGMFILSYTENIASSLYQLKGKSIDAAHAQIWNPQERTLFSSNVPLYPKNVLAEPSGGFIVNLVKEYANNNQQSCLFRYNSQGIQINNEALLAPGAFPKSVYNLLSLPNSQYLLWQNSNTDPDTLTMQKIDIQGNLLLPSAQVLLLPSSAGTTSTLYTRPDFTPLSDGDIIVSWTYDAAIIEYQYRLQRLDSSLLPLWYSDGVNVTPASKNQSFSYSIDASQQIFCTWKEVVPDNNPRIKAQKISPTGEFLWPNEGVILDNMPLYSYSPVGWCGNQQYHCLWYAEQDSEYRLKRQSLNSGGVAQLPEGGLPFYTQLGGYSGQPVTQSLNGNFVTFWHDTRPNNNGIYFQICDAQLNNLLPQNGKKLLPNTPETQIIVQVEKSEDQIAVLYRLYGSNYNYYLQLVNSQGDILLPGLGYYLGQNIFDVVLDFVDGEVYIAWVQYPVEQYLGYIKAQKFVAGVPMWASGGTLIYNTANYVQGLKLKNRYFSWHEYNGLSRQAYAKRVDENGYTVFSWGNNPLQIIEAGEGSYYCSAAGLDGDELIVYVRKETSTNVELYAQKLSPAGERLWGTEGILLDSDSGNILVGGSIFGAGSTLCYRTISPSAEVHLQKLDTMGNKLFGNDGTSFAQTGTWATDPLLYQNQNGWYSLIFCMDAGLGSDYDLYYRMISPEGVPSAFGTQVFCAERLNQRYPSISGSGNKTFIAWGDLRAGLSNTNYSGAAIYAGLLVSDGSEIQEQEMPQATLCSVQSYPNPFMAETTFSFQLKQKGLVSIDIYNLKGQKLQTLRAETELTPGTNQILWNGKDSQGKHQPAGIYLYKLKSGNSIKTGKLVKI